MREYYSELPLCNNKRQKSFGGCINVSKNQEKLWNINMLLKTKKYSTRQESSKILQANPQHYRLWILIHEADPQSRLVVIIVFAHFVRPHFSKQNKLERLWVWPSGSLMTPVLFVLFQLILKSRDGRANVQTYGRTTCVKSVITTGRVWVGRVDQLRNNWNKTLHTVWHIIFDSPEL